MKTKMYIILTYEKFADKTPLNVAYDKEVKQLIKQGKAYSTDVEYNPHGDDIPCISRKVCIDVDLWEGLQLIDDLCLGYECDTLGSLTLEYGHIDAVCMEYFDHYSNERTSAYVSVLTDKQSIYDKVNALLQEDNFCNLWQDVAWEIEEIENSNQLELEL